MNANLDNGLVLVGAGKMGLAMLQAWLANGVPAAAVTVQEPAPSQDLKDLAQRFQFKLAEDASDWSQPAVVIMAVKPQVMDQVFEPAAAQCGPDTVVLSIAAGRSLASFEKFLPEGRAVVRAMPNTPAAIGQGISGAVGNAYLTAEQKQRCESLLAAVGDVVWLDDEDTIDAVTGVSGSGPAYVFHLVETLAAAGVAAGLAPDAAEKLARATVVGAGALLQASPQTDAAKLRKNVTSPGGTTEAALSVLMREKGGLRELMAEAVAAAQKRGRELGQ